MKKSKAEAIWDGADLDERLKLLDEMVAKGDMVLFEELPVLVKFRDFLAQYGPGRVDAFHAKTMLLVFLGSYRERYVAWKVKVESTLRTETG